MRIVQVSGHYPPNFVSGGTLVPERLARAVAAAGESSHVFAGYLDNNSRPLSLHHTSDGHGVEVTWVTTTPWTGWASTENYHNLGVERVFARYLQEVKPDVVHFHSIQTLGAGLLPIAKDAGARVVLTMHDFWWFCARQFLVDREMTPCSLVTTCGVCACEAGTASRLERSEFLLEQLKSADVILAPSDSARDVIVANGVDPDRVRVDENGVDVPSLDLPSDGTEGPSGPVRFMYAGGAQPLKGWDVLVSAVHGITDPHGATLDLYGEIQSRPSGLPDWAQIKGLYERSALSGIMSEHDVLILPSIMRESHSILTREALASGMTVICTDTIGPEEAVADGVNGVVIPAGDVSALREAVVGLAGDRDRVNQLRHAGALRPIRSTADQVRGDLELYRNLTGKPVAAQAAMSESSSGSSIRRVLFVSGIDGAPMRYRVHLPAEALSLHGVHTTIRHYRDARLREDVLECDVVVLYRVPATPDILDLIARLRIMHQGVPVLFDIDDLVFDPRLRGSVKGLSELSESDQELWWEGVARYRTTLESSDMFIGSTNSLVEYVAEMTDIPVARFANGVGVQLAQESDRALRNRVVRSADKVTIGYFSGTTMHDEDWALIEPAVIRVLQENPSVQLVLGGHLKPTDRLADFRNRVRQIPFVNWRSLPGVMRQVDILVAPLADTGPFNGAKSAIKWLEGALVEVPVVATPTEPFREVIVSGQTGVLAATEEEWYRGLSELISSPLLRRSIGARARRKALLEFSPWLQGKRYLGILERARTLVRDQGSRGVPEGWTSITRDEPFVQTIPAFEEYELVENGHPGSSRIRDRVRYVLFRLSEIMRDEGLHGLLSRIKTRLRW